MVYSGKAYAGGFTTFIQIETLKVSSALVTAVDIEFWQHLDISLNIVTAITDLAIAMVLCYLLQKSRTGFQR